MNGNIRFGTFATFLGGVLVANGVQAVHHNLWGILTIALGVLADIVGIDNVNKGVKETVRLHDLEKAAKVNKTVR